MTNLAELDKEIDARLPPMEGWCTPEKAKRLARLVIVSRASKMVELGVFGGRSLLALALGARHQGFGTVDGIDPFEKGPALEGKNTKENDDWWASINYETILRGAREALRGAGVDGLACILRKRSQDIVKEYNDGTVDILHQDSNHSEEVSTEEVRLWMPKLRAGGFWVFDDTNWPSTQKAQAMLFGHGFVLVEDHKEWRIFQAVGTDLKGMT